MRLLTTCILFFAIFPSFARDGSDSEQVSCLFLKSITLSGPHKTRQELILRELNIKEGDCLNKDSIPSLLEVNRLRLMNLRLFNEVTLTSQVQDGDTLTIIIALLHRFPVMPEPNLEFADRNFNVWWTEQHRDWRRINIGLTLNHNNFRGNRETIGLVTQVGYTQKLGLSYSRPFVDKKQVHGYGASFHGVQNREIAYRTTANKLEFARHFGNFMQRRFDGALWYTYRPRYAITHLLALSFHHFWISDSIKQMNPGYLGNNNTQQNVFKLSYRFEYNGVDNWNYPLSGQRLIAILDQKLALEGALWQSSLNLHYDYYLNPWKKWYASMTFRGRVSLPQQQPYIFRQNLGYDFDYVRGYEYYVLDGSCFALLRLNWKRELLHTKIRLPLRFFEVIPIRVYGKVYGDAGIGYNPDAALNQDYLSNKILYSGGLGIDIITLYDIKIRLEYTVNHLGEKGLYIHRSGE